MIHEDDEAISLLKLCDVNYDKIEQYDKISNIDFEAIVSAKQNFISA